MELGTTIETMPAAARALVVFGVILLPTLGSMLLLHIVGVFPPLALLVWLGLVIFIAVGVGAKAERERCADGE